ncbi:MAG: hypothetical protein ACJAZ9_001513 [Neolewinella sp.]|jgi:hypothetical protein
MEYLISGSINPDREATFSVKKSSVSFGVLRDAV